MFLRFIVTCGSDGDVRIWQSLDDDDPQFITVGQKAYSLALKVGGLLLLQQVCYGSRCVNVVFDSSERQAGDRKLQQHRADPHVSRRRTGRHPDPVHNQRHTRRVQQQRLESRSRIRVQSVVYGLGARR